MFCIVISLKAPEVMTENGHDTKVDIWSVGITAIELATGRVPRAELQPMQLVTFVPANPPPRLGFFFLQFVFSLFLVQLFLEVTVVTLEGNFTDLFKEFVSLCLTKDPKEVHFKSTLTTDYHFC
jgi:serine/threonine-protein kinase 24/25/MST4